MRKFKVACCIGILALSTLYTKVEANEFKEQEYTCYYEEFYREQARLARLDYSNDMLEKRRETGDLLTQYHGVYYYEGYQRETYYNLNMSGVVNIMRELGYSEEKYPYWVREDGVKMLGDYVMVAANLSTHPRGSLVDTSLGLAIVCDTGGFAVNSPQQIDIAVNW